MCVYRHVCIVYIHMATRLIPTIAHNFQGYTGSAPLRLVKVFNDTVIMCQYCTYLPELWCVKPEF